tara:strand:- start:277 stop:669 length:393 start_codon:yes stop_codon:yes gene_type:complete
MKICNHCKIEGDFPVSYGNCCSACKNGRYRYNMNRIQQLELLEHQKGRCAICKKEVELFKGKGKDGAHIDHFGVSSVPYSKWEEGWAVRGILCFDCNKYLGSHDTDFFEEIIRYLENPPAQSFEKKRGQT